MKRERERVGGETWTAISNLLLDASAEFVRILMKHHRLIYKNVHSEEVESVERCIARENGKLRGWHDGMSVRPVRASSGIL